MLNLADVGCKGDGVFDNTALIQKALDTSGETVFSFPAGRFRINGTIKVKRRGVKFYGNNFGRTEDNATIIEHYANGVLFQVGDAAESYYDGEQGFKLEDITLVNLAPLQGTLNNPYSKSINRNKFGIDSFAVQDWRGGGMILTNVQIERFEHAIWGVQSDVNRLHNVNLFYNSRGIDFELGSDQLSVSNMYTIGNDKVVNLYGCNGVRFNDCQFVKEGTPGNSPIALDYCNSARFAGCWFEGLNTGLGKVVSYVELGRTAECRGVVFRDSVLAIPNKAASGESVCDYFVEIKRAKNVLIDEVNGFPKNLKKIVLFNGDQQVQQATVLAYLDYTYPDGKVYDQIGTGTAALSFTNRYQTGS